MTDVRNSGEASVPTAVSDEAQRRTMAAEVAALLSKPQKQLASKWFYDAQGAALFDEITRQPEYYLTRTECALLQGPASDWLAASGACTLVELGPGSGEKAAILLRVMPENATYVPIDISTAYLEKVGAELQDSVPGVRVVPLEADIRQLSLPADLPQPITIAFLGSTIGNFTAPAAEQLLRRVHDVMHPGDRLLLGADLRKDAVTLEAAYNDAQGVTADFNRNILHVLNREVGADFDASKFEHIAVYRAESGVVEMHLRALTPMRVTVPDAGTFQLAAGETIRTEISTKYDRATLEELLGAADLAVEHWFTDAHARYALLVARPRS